MLAETLLNVNRVEIPLWDGKGDKVFWRGQVLSLGDFLMGFSKIQELREALNKSQDITQGQEHHSFFKVVMQAQELSGYVGNLSREAYMESLNVFLNIVNLDKTGEDQYREEAQASLKRIFKMLYLDELFRQDTLINREKEGVLCG